MPVFELNGTRRGRVRAFSRAQLPLAAGAFFVTLEGVVAMPDAVGSTSAVLGAALVGVASVLFLALPWERWPVWWLLSIALADVVAVAFLRLAYVEQLPTVGLLAIFPVVWLAYAFGRWAILLAVGSAFLISSMPAIAAGEPPTTAIEVVRIVTLPVIVTGLAVAVGEAARQLASSQQRTRLANRELQESLRRAEDSAHLSRTIFDTVPVALAFYDTDQRLVMANSLAEQAVTLAGFRLDRPPHAGAEVRRADNRTLIPFEDQIVPRALRGDLVDHEMEWIGPVGHQIAIVATAQTVRRTDGSTWGTLIAAHDVTDLARSLRVKEDFIATVSHELRTPLTSIIGYLEVLDGEVDRGSPLLVKALDTIARNAANLEERITQLLDTADQRRSLVLRPTDLTELVTRSGAPFLAQAAGAGLELRVDAPEPQWAALDAEKVEQVVENLLSNAVKYTPPGGRIDLRVAGDDDRVRLSVRDSGIGMSPDEVAQAFDKFWRADSARHEAVQGIGIGLGLVRDIVGAHRGTIDIDSTPGTGTTVTVTLPRHA
ncbi:cell wall metabolism sensor histidine kinase WalK [Nocardioides sp. Arc9.136]|uniref:sensor histidine kinase n=1 Tax=Nocardioides sp. Arc9.136 TaxID=2996826 RepID=UPI002665A198|nr:ATP-binding protein [Nocardioides sp. Arc9.136]WKN48071.1 ATP-binding protein [Nocardioides sp. Arc9.136]